MIFTKLGIKSHMTKFIAFIAYFGFDGEMTKIRICQIEAKSREFILMPLADYNLI